VVYTNGRRLHGRVMVAQKQRMTQKEGGAETENDTEMENDMDMESDTETESGVETESGMETEKQMVHGHTITQRDVNLLWNHLRKSELLP
jgi:ABC-type microcin C transport system permease subunit YejB